MKVMITMVLALSLIGCSQERQYVCIGERQVYSPWNGSKSQPRIEKLVVLDIVVTDTFIDVITRPYAKGKFKPDVSSSREELAISTDPSFSNDDMEIETRAFHREAKIFHMMYEDKKYKIFWTYRGQCR